MKIRILTCVVMMLMAAGVMGQSLGQSPVRILTWEDSTGKLVNIPSLGSVISVNGTLGYARFSETHIYRYLHDAVGFESNDCTGPMLGKATSVIRMPVFFQLADDPRLYSLDNVGEPVTQTVYSALNHNDVCVPMVSGWVSEWYPVSIVLQDVTTIFSPPYSMVYRSPSHLLDE